MSCEDVIHDKPGNSAVAVLKRVNSDIAIMEQRCQFDGGELAFCLLFIVPVNEVGHQGCCFLRSGVFETVLIAGNYAVGTSLVPACVDDIAGLLSARQFTIDRIILPQKRLVKLAYEVLRKRHFLDAGLFLHHFEADIAGFHFLQIFHLGFSYNLPE